MNEKYLPSAFARNILSRQREERQKEQARKLRMTLSIICIVVTTVVAIVIDVVLYQTGYDKGFSDSDSAAYDQAYRYAQSDQDYAANDIPSHGSTWSIRYAIASTSQTVLWDLGDPYNDQIISSSTPLAGSGMPFGIPLAACTVYMVTIDNGGQQAITPVPATQVPGQFLQFVSGCNPASVSPWWVTDQLMPQGPSQLPTTGGCARSDCDDPSNTVP